MTKLFTIKLIIAILLLTINHEICAKTRKVLKLELNCPSMCNCTHERTDCHNNELIDLPTDINPQVKILDLSHNYFQTVPSDLSKFKNLAHLILSYNQISEINKSLLNISSLEILDLQHNYLTSWQRIPVALNLSTSLMELDLSHNSIKNLMNANVLTSKSLLVLRMQNCSLLHIPANFLTKLTNLNTFIVSDNAYLRDLTFLNSDSLINLDAVNCNLEEINLSGLPNLNIAKLRSNRISKIVPKHFRNRNLEYLDLSDNDIKVINYDGFVHLPNLKTLNLSMNGFINLHVNTFSKNLELQKLYISRTYLQQMVQFNITSLLYLDLSINEIQYINSNSLISMPSLKSLLLSNNLISQLPLKIRSISLQHLDLSNCRIIKLERESLTSLANLKILNLSGNKLTTLHPDYLPKDLLTLNLENNPWRCECYSKWFKEQRDYLMNLPKLTDPSSLLCYSPENVSGKTWDRACERVWYEMGYAYVRSEKVWLYVISLILGLSVIFCGTMCIRRMYHVKIMREQAERERMRQEAQERVDRIRREQQRQIEAQQNAPDPRELIRPPSYHEAIRMPPLTSSYASLAASRASLAASRVSLAASNPEISKQRDRTRERSKSPRRRVKDDERRIKDDERRKRRRRRRRRQTTASSDDVTEGTLGTDDQNREDNYSEEEVARSLISVTQRMDNIEIQSENEIPNDRITTHS